MTASKESVKVDEQALEIAARALAASFGRLAHYERDLVVTRSYMTHARAAIAAYLAHAGSHP